MTTNPVGLVTMAEVLSRRKVSRSKLRRDIAAGVFPKPIKDGAKVLFVEAEVDAWLAAKAAARYEPVPA